ncbi:hypothetical protein M885DRAFT_563514 [Pelagophyceae sp. CCMP2097]|nr:hypothetical protein M885DRAFT_563514 [Pelagophyceae sp. CCMP2097]|mmetsp:Transcript_9058/g.31188  ORF Transcript_9058/g.31188 Transcript_9058/m.31188 type:complete len:297 (+) Transcript_9058:132-1022(+)
MASMHPGRLLWLYSARSKAGFYGPRHLNLVLNDDERGGSVEWDSKSGASSVRTTLPPWCARRDGKPPLGALIAIFDEVSTYAGVARYDRAGRPGVSVKLSARVAADAPQLPPGAPLRIETRNVKTGKTLAFVDVEVRCGATDRLVATGQHVKFLPMGLAVEIAMHPWLRRIVQPAVLAHLGRQAVHAFDGSAVSPDDVFKSFKAGTQNVKITEALCNPVGALHGGAAIQLAELAAQRSAGGPEPRAAKSVSALLMSGLRPGETATVSADAAAGCDDAYRVLINKGDSPAYDVRLRF